MEGVNNNSTAKVAAGKCGGGMEEKDGDEAFEVRQNKKDGE